MTSEAGAAELIARCAAVLYSAESSRRPIDPLTKRFPELTVPEAYRIQQANVERRLARGERVVGHKIGLTARAMQELFGVNEPDYGHLLDTMLHDERVPLDLSTLIDPQIEIEPAFVLGSRLQGPNVGVADVLAATEYVCVCFEVIDSRIIDWRVRLQDTVADNGSSARVVLGAFKADPNALELDNLETELELDGVVRRDRQHQRHPWPSGQRHCVAREPHLGVRSHAGCRSRRPAGNLHALRPHRRPRPSGGSHRGIG